MTEKDAVNARVSQALHWYVRVDAALARPMQNGCSHS
jgi:hypothetical protein